MRVTRIALLLGLMVAATVVAVNGAAAAPGGPPGSRVVGQVYVNDNTRAGEHGGRLRPSCRRDADRAAGLPVPLHRGS